MAGRRISIRSTGGVVFERLQRSKSRRKNPVQPVQPVGEPLVLRGPGGLVRRGTTPLVDGYTTGTLRREALPFQGELEFALDRFAVLLKGVKVGIGTTVRCPLLQFAVIQVEFGPNPRVT